MCFLLKAPMGNWYLITNIYTLDFDAIKFNETECRRKGPNLWRVAQSQKMNLVFQSTGEIRQKDIYMGDLPLMTDTGYVYYKWC